MVPQEKAGVSLFKYFCWHFNGGRRVKYTDPIVRSDLESLVSTLFIELTLQINIVLRFKDYLLQNAQLDSSVEWGRTHTHYLLCGRYFCIFIY